MHLISFEANPRQLGKLKKGHPVRIKRGSGFNLIVNPYNYNLVSRAFTKNKGVQLALSPEEIELNRNLTPEQHQAMADTYDNNLFEHLPFAEGGSIFSKLSKGAKHLGSVIKKGLQSEPAKRIGNVLKSTAKDLLHEQIDKAHQMGRDKYGSNPLLGSLMNEGANFAHGQVSGLGLGAGMHRRSRGMGMNAHDALKLANLATAHANHELSKMHNATVHGQITQPPISSYYDYPLAPPSRGTGIHNHHNFIRGRGSLIAQDNYIHPALQSQPYGANFHMQFFLPPEYHKFNDGGTMEGRGLYI
jgi:hypothetical protein